MDSKFYDKYWAAETPPPILDPTTSIRKKRLVETLKKYGLEAGASVLDLGCGRGTFVQLLAESKYKVAGVDISEQAIVLAKTDCPGLDFRVLGRDFVIPAEDCEFDAIWSTEVIEHVFDVHQHLMEVSRVLKPNGIYIFTTPFHGRLKNSLVAWLRFDRHFDPEGEHIRFFDKAGILRCLGRVGLRPMEWGGIGRIWPIYRSWFVVSVKR